MDDTEAERRQHLRVERDREYLLDRVVKVAVVEGFTECWQWQRSLTTQGYGMVHRYESLWEQAHRLSYETFVGPIPDGLEIDHLCFNRRCINPEHLEAVTRAVNVRRAKLRQTDGRGFGLSLSKSGRWSATCDLPRGLDGKRSQKSFTSTDREAVIAKMRTFLGMESVDAEAAR